MPASPRSENVWMVLIHQKLPVAATPATTSTATSASPSPATPATTPKTPAPSPTAAMPAAPPATASARASAFARRSRLIHHQVSSVEILPVKCLNSAVSFFVTIYFYEAKATRLAGEADRKS